MTLTIRPAQEEDAPAIAALLNAIITAGNYTILAGPISAAEQIAFMRSFPQRGVFHVALQDGELVGLQDVQALSPETPALHHVGEIATFVSLARRGEGIGSALSQATFSAAKKLGFSKLMATVRADNPQAVSFYQAQGFALIGTARQHAFINGRYIDEILLEKFLT